MAARGQVAYYGRPNDSEKRRNPVYIQLEPLLALIAGVVAIVVPPRLATRVLGGYLVLWAVLVLAGYL